MNRKLKGSTHKKWWEHEGRKKKRKRREEEDFIGWVVVLPTELVIGTDLGLQGEGWERGYRKFMVGRVEFERLWGMGVQIFEYGMR